MTTSDRPLGELEREVEASRTRLELALNDVSRQMTLESLFSTVKRSFSDELSNPAETLLEKAKNNPLPIALIGAGLGWLILGDGGPDTRTIKRRARHGAEQALHGAEYVADSAIHGAEHLAGSAKHSAEYLASSAKHGAEHLASSAKHGAESLAGSAKHGAESLAGSAKHGAEHLAGSAKHGAESLAGSARQGAERVAEGARSTMHASGGQSGSMGSPQTVRHDIYGRPITSGKEFDDHESLTDRARHALSDAGDAMSDRAHALGHTASGLADDARYHLRETRAQSAEMMHRARDEVVHAYQTNPVVLGLGIAALASLVGVLVPNSRRENEAMGPYAREAKYQAQAAAGDAMYQVEEAADKVLHKAEDAAGEAIGKVEAAAGEAIDKAGKAAEDTGHKVEEKVATVGKKDEGTKSTGKDANRSGDNKGGNNDPSRKEKVST